MAFRAATSDLSLHHPIQGLPNVAAAKSLHESLKSMSGLSSSQRRPGRGEPARRCPGWSAGLGERWRGPLVAVLVGALVSLLIGIAISLLDPLRHAQEIFCGPPSVQRVHALPQSDLLSLWLFLITLNGWHGGFVTDGDSQTEASLDGRGELQRRTKKRSARKPELRRSQEFST